MRLVDADELIKDIQESSKLCMFDDLASKEAYRNMVEFAIYSIEDAETVYDNDRLKELAEADKEGRCVVLPCKVGDTVYYIEKNKKIYESKVHAFSFSKDNLKKYGQIHIYDYDNDNATRKISDFGKTIFLTKEEAEKALEGLKWDIR